MNTNTLHNKCVIGSCFRYGVMVLASVLLCSCLSKGTPTLGDEAPSFELSTLENASIRFVPASGKIHVIYFWADWCPRCEDDFRVMDKLYKRWKNQPGSPELLSVDVGQTDEHVSNFVKRLGTSFPIHMDREGKVARSFGVKGLPTYFVIDAKGIVRHIILGWVDEKGLLQEIRKIK